MRSSQQALINSQEQTLRKLVSIRLPVFLENLSRVVTVVSDVWRNRLELALSIRRSDEIEYSLSHAASSAHYEDSPN